MPSGSAGHLALDSGRSLGRRGPGGRRLFKQLLDGGCEIDFFVDFEFCSRILQTLIGALFHEWRR